MSTMKPLDNGTPPEALGTELLIHICVYLQDGKWHAWNDVVEALTPKVPRSVAGRKGKSELERIRVLRTGKKGRPRDPNSEACVRSGARALLAQALRGWEQYIVKEGPRLNQRVRMKGLPDHIRQYVTM
jgi:hypothetical protein